MARAKFFDIPFVLEGLWLHHAAKFHPFLSLDCVGGRWGKEGIKFCYLATLIFTALFHRLKKTNKMHNAPRLIRISRRHDDGGNRLIGRYKARGGTIKP